MTALPARSLSLYRGQSRVGIGEGPGVPIAHGEQYLVADPPLGQDAELLDRVRPWLTLDSTPSDRRILGERIESWSCFEEREWLFVVRLCAAETYDHRAAYFAHARVWATGGLGAEEDPGLLVGHPEAFDAPFRDGGRRPAAVEPELVPPPKETVEQHLDLAQGLLAALVQARAEGIPVVLAVPLEEFVADGRVSTLAAFVRAALPADLKRGCRLRVYARRPGFFLKRLAADLVVVPLDAVEDALRDRPESTVLDMEGKVRVGRRVSPRAIAYAGELIARFRAVPAELPAFSSRFAARREGRGLPDDAEVRAVPLVYNLGYCLRSSAEKMGDLWKYLTEKAVQLDQDRDGWQRWITDEEWLSFPSSAFSDLLLRPPEQLDSRVRALQEAIEDVLDRSETQLDLAAGEFQRPDERARLVAIHNHHPSIVPAATLAAATRRWTSAELADTGRPEVALQAELAQGVLHLREREPGELVALATRPRCLSELIRATSMGDLGPAWAEEFVTSASAGEIQEAAPKLLSAVVPGEDWGGVRCRLLDRLRRLDPLPPSLLGPLVEAAGRWNSSRDLATGLRLADLAERIAASTGVRPEWTGLATDELLRLAATLAEGDGDVVEESRSLFIRELDRRLAGCTEEVTELLIRSGWWFFWRRRSDLDGARLRQAALAWLRSPAWVAADHPEPTREAWEKVLGDLRAPGLGRTESAAAVRSRSGSPPWPWIPPFEEAQLEELLGLADGFAALSELAGLALSSPPPGRVDLDRVVDEAVGVRFKLPREAIAWACARGPGERDRLAPLSLEVSERLLEELGDGSPEARAAYRAAIFGALPSRPQDACQHAARSGLWRSGDFLEEVRRWLAGHGDLSAVAPSVLGEIEQMLARGEAVELSGPENRQHAQQASCRGFPHIAALFSPSLTRVGRQQELVRRALVALRHGSSEDGCWDELAAAIPQRRGKARTADPHPVAALAGLVLEVEGGPPRDGWAVFKKASRRLPALLSADGRDGPRLPCLALAAALEEGIPLGRLALDLASERAIAVGQGRLSAEEEWWWGLVSELGFCRRDGHILSADDRVPVVRSLLARTAGLLPGPGAGWLRQALGSTHGAGPGTTEVGQMSDRVTFFVRRGSPSAMLETIRGEGEVAGHQLEIYVPARPPSLRRNKPPTSESDFRALRAEIQRALERDRHGRGGVVVEVRCQGATHQVIPWLAKGPEEVGPWEALVLRIGRPPCFEELRHGMAFELSGASRLVLPVDRESQHRLHEFVDSLDDLPEDVKSLVLYSLGAPDHEERILRLEQRQAPQRALPSRRSAGPGGRLKRLWGWLTGPAPAGLVLLLLLVSTVPVLSLLLGPGSWSSSGVAASADRALDTQRADSPPEQGGTRLGAGQEGAGRGGAWQGQAPAEGAGRDAVGATPSDTAEGVPTPRGTQGRHGEDDRRPGEPRTPNLRPPAERAPRKLPHGDRGGR